MSIFEEPPEGVDESWTDGAMLGGMCGYGDEELADSYVLAGDILVAAVVEGGELGRDLINPVLYVYRHGIELYLKCVVQPEKRDHDLGSLLKAFCQHVQSRYGESVPAWITELVSDFATHDPGSDMFRYGISRRGSPLAGGEAWIRLPRLKQQMALLRRNLRRVIVADATGGIPPRSIAP